MRIFIRDLVKYSFTDGRTSYSNSNPCIRIWIYIRYNEITEHREVSIWKQFLKRTAVVIHYKVITSCQIFTLPDKTEKQIGVWAKRHRRYLKSNHRMLYYNLLTSCKLNNYLVYIEQRAENLFELTVRRLVIFLVKS